MKLSLLKNPTTLFFLLVFVISWSLIYILFGSEGIPATKENQEFIGMTILLGPSIAGLLLIILYDKVPGLKLLGSRLVKFKVNIRWYFVALLTAPLTTFLTVLILTFFVENVRPNFMLTDDIMGSVSLGLIGGMFVGFFEELGWTGFAMPKLLKKHGIFYTGLVIGMVWGAWHFILFWEYNSFKDLIPFLLLVARLFSWLPAYRILMVWLYKNTNSHFLVVLMHLALVASLAIIDPILDGKELLIYILIRAIILWVLVGIISFKTAKSLNHTKQKRS